jgi:serine O-acetyltransferase
MAKENINYVSIFNNVVEELSDLKKYNYLYHHSINETPLPSVECLYEMVDHLKKILFPGFFGNSDFKKETMHYYVGAKLEIIYRTLVEQIKRGLCFSQTEKGFKYQDYEKTAQTSALNFISSLPKIKHLLSTDVIAAYKGDPAAKNYGEAIFCYPSISALTYYRIAHELVVNNIPLIPRIITEMSHSNTGIDIHPGAEIGEYFFIDHGTGVVIGETSIIGKNVRLYQGVTLGAKSFPLDEHGKPIKGIPRHPIVEDDVIIYSNSTILGRITLGKGSVIGANMWITKDIPPFSILSQIKK